MEDVFKWNTTIIKMYNEFSEANCVWIKTTRLSVREQ